MDSPNLQESVRYYSGLIVNRLVDGLQASEQSASGNLEESIGYVMRSKPSGYEVDIELADYYKYVDQGRKAGGMPPVSKLREWLRYPNVKDRLGLNQLPDSQLNGIAYLIARKIAKEGTKGNHFFTNVVDNSGIIDEMTEGLANAATQDLSTAIDRIAERFGR